MPRLTLPAFAERALTGWVSGNRVVSGVSARGVDSLCNREKQSVSNAPVTTFDTTQRYLRRAKREKPLF